ncbi:hypothetical protein SYYSPA8_22740 [Streptomyces yaizuensis]|uniref:Uncharacterized protein n=2 Tax=Streptomyces yaizuensis TaxID=2989713 RepID=A0ABQ5P3K2_9ACTN|nr:hypothetical protein SYYSPA8_22740 [Streptomyces sp. YSPA8]
MTTDAWERSREGIVRLWRRVQPHRAELVAAELDASQEDVVRADTADDEETLNELRLQWQGRLRRLLADQPEAVEALRDLLDELRPEGAEEAGAPSAITQRATASGSARIYQAGGDQHIHER